jgi:hypothetical protein
MNKHFLPIVENAFPRTYLKMAYPMSILLANDICMALNWICENYIHVKAELWKDGMF